jgi:hypothetical protein
MHFTSVSTLFTFSLLASNVAAHGLLTTIKGANGVNGIGLAITDTTGKKTRLFNQAPRYIKGDTSACGSQKLDGKQQTPINFQKALTTAINAGLPSAAADGTVKMTLFQVNADGAGPYSCEVSADASGKNFQTIQVTKQVPGTKGKSDAANQAFELDVKLPQGIKCTGPKGACLVRCKNGNSQPFGGCAVVAGPTPNKKRDTNELTIEDIEELNEEDDEIEPEERKPKVISRFFDISAMEQSDLA